MDNLPGDESSTSCWFKLQKYPQVLSIPVLNVVSSGACRKALSWPRDGLCGSANTKTTYLNKLDAHSWFKGTGNRPRTVQGTQAESSWSGCTISVGLLRLKFNMNLAYVVNSATQLPTIPFKLESLPKKSQSEETSAYCRMMSWWWTAAPRSSLSKMPSAFFLQV